MSSTLTRNFLETTGIKNITLALECTANVYSTLLEANTETRGLEYVSPNDSRMMSSRDSTPFHDPDDEALEHSYIGYVCLLKQARNPGHCYSFGRNERRNSVVLPANSRTSRLHFRVYLNSKNAWMIADDSSTGTVVNGEGLAGPLMRGRAQSSSRSINCLTEVALNPESSITVKAGLIEFRIHVIADPEGLRASQASSDNSLSYVHSESSLSRAIVSSSSDVWSLFQIDPEIWSEYYILEGVPPAGNDRAVKGVAIRTIMRKTTGEYGIGKCFNAHVQVNGINFYRKGKNILEQGKHQFIDGFLGDGYGLNNANQRLYVIARQDWSCISLKTWVEKFAPPTPDTLEFDRCVTYLHQSGVIHHDVKPDAILVTYVDRAASLPVRLSGFSEATFHYNTPLQRRDYHVDIRDLSQTMHNIIESFNPAEVHNRLGAGFKQLVRSGLRGPLRTSAEIHESFDHCVRPSWEKPFSGVRFDRRYVLNAIHGQGGILVSVEDVIEFVRFHGNHDLDAYTTRVPGEINVTIAGSNGRYCSLRRADAFTNRYYCFSNLADEYGGLDDEIEKAPKETTVGDPITLTLWASEFFHMHDPSQLCNISQILYCLEDATIKDLSLFFEPTIVQEIHGVNEWRGVYIDISSFLNICDYLQENSQIRLSDSARSRLNASLVPEHPFVTVDNERFIIIHTERLMPPAFLLERATCSADRYHIRGVGPKFAECGSGGKFSLRRNDVDHVIQECDSNGLYNAKEAIERIKSGSRSSQWTTIYRKPPPPVIVEDSGSSDEDDEPRFRWSRPRA